MKPTFKLKDLIQQGESAISATSTLIGQGMVVIDCSEVESLTEEQLSQLFSGIPDKLKGVRAILVYPMNALINSQEEEFKKFLDKYKEISGRDSHIRVVRYTKQENLSQKDDIQKNPPHILLTNYVMLELMLSRVYEQKLVQSPILKYLVHYCAYPLSLDLKKVKRFLQTRQKSLALPITAKTHRFKQDILMILCKLAF